MSPRYKKILVVRNDKLGDFMLAWPALAVLGRSLPDSEIHVLINPVNQALAGLCPDIAEAIPDPGAGAGIAKQFALARRLRAQRYDAVITLFSTLRAGWILTLARIPYRLAPATKIAQVFYHARLTQRRSQSAKPEYAYNQDLVLRFLQDAGIAHIRMPSPPYLAFEPAACEQLRQAFCRRNGIAPDRRLVFLHPGSGGSANNLDPEQYGRLGRALKSARGHHIVVTAGPGELELATMLAGRLGDIPHTVYHSTEGLERFARHIAFSDLFISGSTGPLHIAGALNRNTAAFYPRRRSSTALRWQTINEADRRLSFSPAESAGESDMSSIDTEAAAAAISAKFLV